MLVFNIKNPFNVSFVDLAFDGMCFENMNAITSYLKRLLQLKEGGS